MVRVIVLLVVGAVIVMIAVGQRGIGADSARATYTNILLSTITLGVVCIQVVLAIEQVQLAKRQMSIVQKQDSLLYGTAIVCVTSPDADEIGKDELAGPEQLRLFGHNDGTRIARRLELRVALPGALQPTSADDWKAVGMIAEIPDHYCVWKRECPGDIHPGELVLLSRLELSKVRVEAIASPILWQITFDGGVSPASGRFGELKTTHDGRLSA